MSLEFPELDHLDFVGAIDFDGIQTDTPLQRLIWAGMKGSNPNAPLPDYSLFSGHGLDEAFDGLSEQDRIAYEKELFAFSGDPIEGCFEALRLIRAELRRAGQSHEAVTLSSGYDWQREAKIEWGKRHFTPIFASYFLGSGELKSDLVRRLGAGYIVEDRRDYALDCAVNAGVLAVVIDRYPWSLNDTGHDEHPLVIHVPRWAEVPETVIEHLLILPSSA